MAVKDAVLPAEQQAMVDALVDQFIKQLRTVDKRLIPGRTFDPETDPEKRRDKGFNTFGEFLWTIKHRRGDERLKTLKAGLVEGDDTAGGYLVPEEFRNQILMDALEQSVMRRVNPMVIPMRADSIRIPRVKDTAHSSSVFGGMVAYWTEEQGDLTESEPKFGSVLLIAKKLTGYTYAANELVADSAVALEAMLIAMFSACLAYFEDKAFIRGSGVGQPLGFLKSGALLSVNRSAASAIAIADLGNMMSRLLPQSMSRVVWIANQGALSKLIQLGSTYLTWLSNGIADLTKPIPAVLLGRPIYFSEHCSAVGTAGDINLVDPKYYLIGDRQAISVAASDQVRFTTDETAWRFVQRVDGQPWVDDKFTPENGSTLSPFVTLHSTTNGGD